jgi:hypothetical protein
MLKVCDIEKTFIARKNRVQALLPVSFEVG